MEKLKILDKWKNLSAPTTKLIMFLSLSLFFRLVAGTTCLRDLELSVPPAVALGEDVRLSCHYHLQGEELYTVKLYKGPREFLQLVPSKTPPLKTFPLKGLHVQVRKVSGFQPFLGRRSS